MRSLNDMDPELSHFTIDDYLKRYKDALVHLTKCAPTKTFEDVVAYVRKHELYREAMQLYKEDREQYDVPPNPELTDKRQFLDTMPIILLIMTKLKRPGLVNPDLCNADVQRTSS
jgi:hypothetical protein